MFVHVLFQMDESVGTHASHVRSGMTIRLSHLYNAGKGHFGFPPTRPTILAPSDK